VWGRATRVSRWQPGWQLPDIKPAGTRPCKIRAPAGPRGTSTSRTACPDQPHLALWSTAMEASQVYHQQCCSSSWLQPSAFSLQPSAWPGRLLARSFHTALPTQAARCCALRPCSALVGSEVAVASRQAAISGSPGGAECGASSATNWHSVPRKAGRARLWQQVVLAEGWVTHSACAGTGASSGTLQSPTTATNCTGLPTEVQVPPPLLRLCCVLSAVHLSDGASHNPIMMSNVTSCTAHRTPSSFLASG
jgi:hypothetical protein